MTLKLGILLFDDAEEFDFAGPYEVFTMSNSSAAQVNRTGAETKEARLARTRPRRDGGRGDPATLVARRTRVRDCA